MELGLTSFAETISGPDGGPPVGHGERLRQILEEVTVAESVGLDVYGLGEHHRPDFASSSPATVLAAAAGRTNKIRLFPAVSILSTDDPVRVFQQYATLDLVSSGRAGPNFSSVVAPSSSLSLCSGTRSRTTTTCLPKN